MDELTYIKLILAVLTTLGVPAVVKYIAPRSFDALVNRARFKAEQQAEMDKFKREREQSVTEAEQREEVALWASMVKLQTEALKQNERLLEFLTSNIDGEMKVISSEMKQGFTELREAWIQAFADREKTNGELFLLRQEVTALISRQNTLELSVERLMATMPAPTGN